MQVGTYITLHFLNLMTELFSDNRHICLSMDFYIEVNRLSVVGHEASERCASVCGLERDGVLDFSREMEIMMKIWSISCQVDCSWKYECRDLIGCRVVVGSKCWDVIG